MHFMHNCVFRILQLLSSALFVYSGWVDPDTLHENKFLKSLKDDRIYELVFSDEFNTDGRYFYDGTDPRWTSINKDDYTNFALQYYNSKLANTSNGYLNIATVVEDVTFDIPDTITGKTKKMTKNYQSGMIQGWNKFCFTGGIVEVSAKLPGRSDIGGMWPAMWLLGNLARATFVGSSNNMWPWSYDSCSKDLQKQQLISACNIVNHFDLHSYQGRGAPEIDILEAMPGKEKLINTPINKPYFSTSLQIAPGNQDYRPTTGEDPVPGLWYEHGLDYGKNTSLNIFFYGMHLAGQSKSQSYLADALSANRALEDTHFNDFHTYRIEWIPGKDGYIQWYLDNEFVYSISADALNLTGSIIPEEPMYLLFNTAVSSTWGFPAPCPAEAGCPCDCFDCRKPECACAVPNKMCENFPAYMLIDYVRVFQAAGDDDQVIGCSTPSHPTKRFIQGHPYKYMMDDDKMPLQPLQNGGGTCTTDSECGKGSCVHLKCECQSKLYTGPHCLAPNGFDDIDWDKDERLLVYLFIMPHSFFWMSVAAGLLLIAAVYYNFWYQKHLRVENNDQLPMSDSQKRTHSNKGVILEMTQQNRSSASNIVGGGGSNQRNSGY